MLAFPAILMLLTVSPIAAPPPPATPSGSAVPPAALPGWYNRLSLPTPGAFPPPRSYDASYRITWNGLEAAHVEARIKSPPNGTEIRTSVKADTTGGARALYKLDATQLSVVDRPTLHPKFFEQSEQNSRKSVAARVDFSPEGAVRRNYDLSKGDAADSAAIGKPRHFLYPGLLDMEGVLLYLRSQPLADGDEKTLLLMTAGSPYLATVRVVGHGHVHVRASDYPAIECSLKLEKVGKNGALEPRKGFKSAHAWLSDDSDRLLIKAQGEVFIGTVNLELEKATFVEGTPLILTPKQSKYRKLIRIIPRRDAESPS